MDYRDEKDSLGTVRVPADAYYGAQTQRALENFPISAKTLPRSLTRALALVKECAARVNAELGQVDPELADSIAVAAREVYLGRLDDHLVVDVFQTGSGTSTNMNMNEVIASRANEMLTGRKGGKTPVHPNDHVNLGQSSNDVIPTAIHIAALSQIKESLSPALQQLCGALSLKAVEFAEVRKIGRTHLQDAVPMSLGDEFSGYSRQMALGIRRLADVEGRLAELALGGTAVGNGLNTHREFAPRVIGLVSEKTGIAFREAADHFEAQAAKDAAVEASGVLKTIAVSLSKIANDLRWLASGPRCGLGEINLPSLQPGSSIMPGKVNPVIPEAVLQVAAQVVGNDAVVALAGMGGVFELNVMMPVLAHNLLESIELLAAAAKVLAEKCVEGITANAEHCAGYIERSLALATALVPHIGYDRAAAIAGRAYATGKTVREIARQEKVLPPERLQEILPADK